MKKGFLCIRPALKKATEVYSFGNDSDVKFYFQPFDPAKDAIEECATLEGTYKILPKEVKKGKLFLNNYDGPQFSHTKVTYNDLIAKTIDHIQNSDLEKIVISRYTSVTNQFNVFELFEKLCIDYARANVYLISHPDAGVWMAATPETLLKVSNLGKIRTMSLAGSKMTWEEWSDKEKKEQMFVTDYIAKTLEDNGATNVSVREPQTVIAGPIQHLRTHIEGLINDVNPLEMAKIMHPTPATCGTPKEKALKDVFKFEEYDRDFYAGFIALDKQKSFESYVNLRCMKIYKDRIKLFAGGGITEDSEPDKEWIETQRKISTISTVLKELREQ